MSDELSPAKVRLTDGLGPEPAPPNAEGATMCTVRWMVETENGWLGAYDKAAFRAYAALLDIWQRDCRTCHYFTTKSGGCTSVVLCVNANRYTATTPKQYWISASDAPNVLENGPNVF